MGKVKRISSPLVPTGNLTRFIPEPKSRVGSSFQSVMSGVGNLLSGGAAGAASALTNMNSEYAQLMGVQIQAQQQMQRVSMSSNIEKSKHESKMAAIRNMRAA